MIGDFPIQFSIYTNCLLHHVFWAWEACDTRHLKLAVNESSGLKIKAWESLMKWRKCTRNFYLKNSPCVSSGFRKRSHFWHHEMICTRRFIFMKSTKWPPCWLHDQMPDPGFRGHKMPRVYYDRDRSWEIAVQLKTHAVFVFQTTSQKRFLAVDQSVSWISPANSVGLPFSF